MKKVLIFILYLFYSINSYCQSDSLTVFKQFFFSDGVTVSSEGFLKDDKPDGYWKSYYSDGSIKSEGNRVDFMLSGTWKFYDENGNLSLSIDYLNGKKSGIRTLYSSESILSEQYIDDIKEGMSYQYDLNHNVIKSVNYVNGLEEGMMKEFSSDGRIIRITNYKSGFILSSEWINRIDASGNKQGKWLEFHDNGKIFKESFYLNDKLNGFVKYYDVKGSLTNIEQYNLGSQVVVADNIINIDIRKDYYSNGKVKTMASYKNGIPEGIRREYDTTGRIVESYLFDDGKIVAEGIIDEQLTKHGLWIEYYTNGNKKSEGYYNNGVRTGNWIFYNDEGGVEQEGFYDKDGHPDDIWVCYYPSGNILKEESYMNGLEYGMYIEYSDQGMIIVQGNYLNGLKEGKWTYSVNGVIEKGEYLSDRKNGLWTIEYEDGSLIEQNTFIEDNPDGIYRRYYSTGVNKGRVFIQGHYVSGQRDGEWIYFDEEGNVDLIINYNDGEEID